MLVKTEAFILSILKYNDTDAIVKTFTKQTGFTTFFVKNLYKSKKGKIKKAYLQASAIVDLIFNQRQKSGMEYIKEISPAYHYQNLHTDFDKMNVSVFMREILIYSLPEEPRNEELFEFIKNQFITLDKKAFEINFHLYFLVKLLLFIGIAPDHQTNGKYFDLQEGIFTDSPISFDLCMNQNQSLLFRELLGTIFAAKKEVQISNNERRQLLEKLIKYMELHIANFKKPKSLHILSSLYS